MPVLLLLTDRIFDASHRRIAYFVDRILNGRKPADLPVEQLSLEFFGYPPFQLVLAAASIYFLL